MLVVKASEENQNAEGTSVDFELTRSETQELEDTGYVVTDNGYCITMDSDGETQVWKPFLEWSGMKLNYGGRK